MTEILGIVIGAALGSHSIDPDVSPEKSCRTSPIPGSLLVRVALSSGVEDDRSLPGLGD